MAQIDIQVPDIGDFDEVAVIELLVKPGDTVTVDQSLITVESDKASMEIPSSHAGVVTALKVKLGDKVKQGSVILTVEASGAATADQFNTLYDELKVTGEMERFARSVRRHARRVSDLTDVAAVDAVRAHAARGMAGTSAQLRRRLLGRERSIAQLE